jgi:arsenite-transporting ATPase
VRCLLFTGKGGGGATTVAAATATLAAQHGHRTLVASADPLHGLATALDHPLGPEPVMIEPGLSAQQIDVQRAFEDRWRAIRALFAPAWDAAGMDPIEVEELTQPPGAAEMVTLLELRDQIASGAFDLVVVDAGPTVQTLRLLTFPETVSWYLRRLLPVEGFLARTGRPAFGRAARAGGLAALTLGVREAFAGLARAAGEAGRMLADATATSVRLVLTPETAALAAARQAFTALSLHGFGVDAVVVNRVLAAGGGDAWRAGWAAAHREQIAAVEACFAPVPVLRAAYRAGEPVGLEELAAFGAAAYDGRDPAPMLCRGHPDAAGAGLVERTDDGFSLSLGLPFVESADVDLARLGNDLVVTVGSHRRCVPLPAALRRCDVRAASLRDDRLVVSFVPDPDQWMRA